MISSRLKSSIMQKLSLYNKIISRTILCPGYSCETEWSKRLEQDDTLKHISSGNLK